MRLHQKTLLIGLLLLLLITGAQAVPPPDTGPDPHRVIPFNVTVWDGLNVFGPADSLVHVCALHLGVGRTGKLTGIEAGLLATHALKPSWGIQLAPLLTVSDQRFSGIQLSGLLSLSGAATDTLPSSGVQVGGLLAIAQDEFAGIQSGGLITAATEAHGIQSAGLIALTTHAFTGMQFGGLVSFAGEGGGGIQVGGLIAANGGTFTGVQFAGLLSASTMRLRGIQTAGLLVYSPMSPWLQAAPVTYSQFGGGVQIGLVNIHSFAQGVQIGLINRAEIHDGWPVGLVSLIEDHPQQVVFWSDEAGATRFAWITGNRRLYSVIGLAGNTFSTPRSWAFGGGVGWHSPLRGNGWSLKTDLLVWNYQVGEFISRQPLLLAEWRLPVTFEFGKYWSAWAGPSLRYATSEGAAASDLLPNRAEMSSDSSGWSGLWLGGFAGVSYTLPRRGF